MKKRGTGVFVRLRKRIRVNYLLVRVSAGMSGCKLMRAIRVSEFGAPSVLKLCSDVTVPQPGQRQVRPAVTETTIEVQSPVTMT